MTPGIFYGVGAAQALWRLAQLRTHKSFLDAPLQREFAQDSAPSAMYHWLCKRAWELRHLPMVHL